jgi:chromate reductase
MILVVAATNRPGSKTLVVAEAYTEQLKEQTQEEVELLSMCDIQEGMLHMDMYQADKQGALLRKAQDEFFIPADKWVIVSPEYNGGYPGSVKLLIDALSVRKAEETFHQKKVALVGVSSGRTGNWLGMNHLTAVLHYLKMHVYFNKLAISHIEQVVDENGIIVQKKTSQFIKNQIRGFLLF